MPYNFRYFGIFVVVVVVLFLSDLQMRDAGEKNLSELESKIECKRSYKIVDLLPTSCVHS